MPYSKLDDYLIHQLPTTLDHVHDTEKSWSDRFYFNCHARDGSVLLTTGYGVNPNSQSAHGYAKLGLADGRHWDIDAHRPCIDDRADMHAGPLRWTIVEPLQEWRLELGPNDSGLEWDITYRARAPIWELVPIFIRKKGRAICNFQHIQQSATYSGWIRADGEEISVDGFYGSRDRTFGVRDAAEVDFWIWFSAQFDDRAIAAWVFHRADGTVAYVDGGFCHEDGTISKRFVRFEHDIAFDGDRKRTRSADVTFTDEDGKQYRLKANAEHQNVNVYYGRMLEPGHGPVNSQRWDASDPDVLGRVEELAGAGDQLMRYELDGMVGYGIFELLVSGDGLPRYPNWKPVKLDASATLPAAAAAE